MLLPSQRSYASQVFLLPPSAHYLRQSVFTHAVRTSPSTYCFLKPHYTKHRKHQQHSEHRVSSITINRRDYIEFTPFGMLPHSPSNAGHHLRRAKSTASTHTRRSQPSVSSFLDDTAIKEQALIAAMTAFESANGKAIPRSSLDLQSRRSQKGRASEGEGSHFQACNLGRRQSAKRLSTDSSSGRGQGRARRSTISSTSSASTNEYHRQQFTTPAPINVNSASTKHGPSSLTFRRIRKSRSLYSSDSRQRVASFSESLFHGQAPIDPAIHSTNATPQSISEMDPTTKLTTSTLLRTRNHRYQVDPNVSKARDDHLNQFRRHSVRHRSSIMFTPFRKRQEKVELQYTVSPNNGITYDHIVSSPLPPTPVTQRRVSQETRATSNSIKERIRRVFRKSTVSQNLPVQHVEATRKYFGDQLIENDQFSGQIGSNQNAYHALQSQTSQLQDPLGPRKELVRAPSPAQSDATLGTSKSRVTSWTDSTITATAASRCSNRLDSIQEDKDHDHTEATGSRVASNGSSIFRRIIRKASRMEVVPVFGADLGATHSADESLKEASIRQASNITSTSESARDTLPSQRKWSSVLASKPSQFFRSTVRAVTPDVRIFQPSTKPRAAPTPIYRLTPTPSKCDLPATAAELLGRGKTPVDNKDDLPRTRNRLQKAPPKVTKPTPDQIASRVEQTNDRWKSPLEEASRSLFYPRSPGGRDRICGSTADDCPLERAETEDIARFDTANRRGRADTISPSLYSRGTDSASIPPIFAITANSNDSKVSVTSNRSNGTGTAVISASTPVSSYMIGSSKPQESESRQLQASADWRAWMSNQVEEIATPPPEDITLNGNITIRRKDRSGHRREYQQIVEGENVTIGNAEGNVGRSRASSRISDEDRPLSRIRESDRQTTRSSSRMNDRFPMIETGRPSSATRSHRKHTPPTNQPRTQTSSHPTATLEGKKKTAETQVVKEQLTNRPKLENVHPKTTTSILTTKVHRSTSTLLEKTSLTTQTEDRNPFLASPAPPRPTLTTHKSTPQIRPRPSSALESTPPNTLRRKPLTPNRGTSPETPEVEVPYTHAHSPAKPSNLRYAKSAYDLQPP